MLAYNIAESEFWLVYRCGNQPLTLDIAHLAFYSGGVSSGPPRPDLLTRHLVRFCWRRPQSCIL